MRSPGGKLPPDTAAALLDAIRDTADLGGVGVLVTQTPVDDPELVFANPGAAALFGYELEEFLETSFFDHFEPDGVAQLRESRKLDGVGASLGRVELPIIRKDGSRSLAELTTTRIMLGGVRANVTFLQDASPRQRAIQALAASEARFRTVVESAPDGVAILRQRTIVYLNRAAGEMLGYQSPEQGVGRVITDLLHPEDAPKATVRIGQLLDTRLRHSGPTEYRSRRVDGQEISVEISSIPIEYEGGPAVLAFARDITERKAIHGRMVQADRLAAVGSLAAGIAHEINNPLAYVLLGLSFLERELPKLVAKPGGVEDALERLREVRGGAERVGHIVRDLKTFARADEMTRGPVDLRSVIEASLKIADNEIRHRAALVRDYEEAPPIDGNGPRLEQVFLNLLVNSAHAVSERGHATSEVRVSVRRGAGATVVAEVSDNGTGIPAEIIGRVFDPFFTTKPIGVGTGLGLPICRAIVEAFGGVMALESTAGRGTTVRVELPVHDRFTDPKEVAPQRRSSRPPQVRGRVLIVDDEPLVANLLSRMLGTKHDVSVATSGKEALAAIGEHTFDAIVCDVMMPEMTGMDVYAALRERDPSLAERVVFMTGGAFVPSVAEFLATVDNPKLDKPFDMDMLAQALRRVTGESDL